MERKLAAILSADVKGYSRLMGQDEMATVRTLTAYREVLATLIQQRRGRVVDVTGDNLLAEFASVVDAVQCAGEIQRELRIRNAQLPVHRRMEFRIGINLGDVIVDGDRIYGDGVNMAARVQGLAEGGGICLSGIAYDQIENKLALGYEFLGAHIVKNIAKPVRVYRVRMEPGAPAPGGSDAKRVGLGPWRRVSLAGGQEYFSDGLTEDLITGLSKLSGLFVIARNSVFHYKGKAVKPAQVSRELGVRYVLEGSVRKPGNRVRITAQLIDATTEYHLWAERYDRELKDIFAVQDEVTQKIVRALAVNLTDREQGRLGRPPTGNLEAYDYVLRGMESLRRHTREANAEARQLFLKALDLDPEYGMAYAGLGWAHFLAWTLQWSQDADSLERAFDLARKALARNDSLSEAHVLLGYVYLWKKQHEQAIAQAERVIALAPNAAGGYEALGEILTFAGRAEEAIGLVKKAMRLNPRHPADYLWALGHAHYSTGRASEATDAMRKVLQWNPDSVPARAFLAVLLSEAGREEEARAEGAEALRLSPQATLESLRERLPYKNAADLDRFLAGLRKAGLG